MRIIGPRPARPRSRPHAACLSQEERQGRLADAYLNTRRQREPLALLERGGAIGGSSAGATVLGSFPVRGDTEGNKRVRDPDESPVTWNRPLTRTVAQPR